VFDWCIVYKAGIKKGGWLCSGPCNFPCCRHRSSAWWLKTKFARWSSLGSRLTRAPSGIQACHRNGYSGIKLNSLLFWWCFTTGMNVIIIVIIILRQGPLFWGYFNEYRMRSVMSAMNYMSWQIQADSFITIINGQNDQISWVPNHHKKLKDITHNWTGNHQLWSQHSNFVLPSQLSNTINT
jgi:hypothetical protein